MESTVNNNFKTQLCFLYCDFKCFISCGNAERQRRCTAFAKPIIKQVDSLLSKKARRPQVNHWYNYYTMTLTS